MYRSLWLIISHFQYLLFTPCVKYKNSLKYGHLIRKYGHNMDRASIKMHETIISHIYIDIYIDIYIYIYIYLHYFWNCQTGHGHHEQTAGNNIFPVKANVHLIPLVHQYFITIKQSVKIIITLKWKHPKLKVLYIYIYIWVWVVVSKWTQLMSFFSWSHGLQGWYLCFSTSFFKNKKALFSINK